ncbi:MAG: hypothetical protein K2J36_03900 [Ruminococcus sp.]|nr:hypothetical protein [Ruminococcus sp.]
MKNLRKLTALVASAVLAVGAVPANTYAEKIKGDWDNDDIICLVDVNAYLNHIINVENGTVEENVLKWVNENHDVNGDGIVDKRDFIIVSLQAIEPAKEDTKIGDIDHSGSVMDIDGYMLKYYLEDVAEGNADFYTEEQIANFNAYGDVDKDGDVDETDAELIITGDYRNFMFPHITMPDGTVHIKYPNGTTIVEKDGNHYALLLDGTILDTDEKLEKFRNDFYNDTTGRGDVNHDGSVDDVDANMILEYYASLATDHYDDYTEEEHENFKKYGDVFNDGVVDHVDASWILSKYASSKGAEILKGDVNQDGVVDIKDAELLDDFMWNYFFDRKEYTEEEIQYYITYGDMNGDGYVWDEDIILMGEVNSDITLNTELGDVNHDGYINSIDATTVNWYYSELSCGNYDNYTAEEHENFLKYGDLNHDGYVNSIDSTLILSMYAENSTN